MRYMKSKQEPPQNVLNRLMHPVVDRAWSMRLVATPSDLDSSDHLIY
jgi:hypothetical protein